jgi:hypothetical protein
LTVLLAGSTGIGIADTAARLQWTAWERETEGDTPASGSERTSGMRWLIADPWFRDLVTADPAMSLRAAERCLVVCSNRAAECRPWFEKALRENRLHSAAALGLAQLAEEAGNLNQAAAILRETRRIDRSFAVLWSQWNFELRHAGSVKAQSLALEVIRQAPPRFRGDFPFYQEAGISPEVVMRHLREGGSMERARAYALYLASVGNAEAGRFARSLVLDSPASVGTDFAKAYLAFCLAGRLGHQGAAEVWRAAVAQGLFPDRRESGSDDPMLNPNPLLQKPFLERGFDWSEADAERAAITPQEDGQGLHLVVTPTDRDSAATSNPVVLLSKLITLSPGREGIRILLEPNSDAYHLKRAHLQWVAYDAATGRELAVAKEVEVGAANRDSGSAIVSELRLPSGESPEAVWVGLVCDRHQRARAEAIDLRIRRVRFEIIRPDENRPLRETVGL